MLRLSGYQVTSVLGNQEAMQFDDTTLAEVDLVVVGFSAPYSIREAIVHWFKTQHPRLPVLVMQSVAWEKFPEADAAVLSEEPTVWLEKVGSILNA